MAGKRWTYQETQMAFALYYLIPANEIDKKGADVWKLAEGLGRTPRSVAMKLWNIASLDEHRIDLGKAGLRHGSSLDDKVWADYREQGDEFVWEGLKLLDTVLSRENLTPAVQYATSSTREGRERVVQAKQRINQGYFKNCLLQNYDNRCCLTGLRTSDLLVASHIKPWSKCENGAERVDPKNGLLLNALHDKAFDRGLITLSRNMEIIVSRKVTHDEPNDLWIWSFNGKQIEMPSCNAPALEYIEYHQDCIFQGFHHGLLAFLPEKASEADKAPTSSGCCSG